MAFDPDGQTTSAKQGSAIDHNELLVHRTRRASRAETQAMNANHPIPSGLDRPPIYIIDLSLPPAERYTRLATDYKSNIFELSTLFDEVVPVLHQGLPVGFLKRVARTCLRRVYSKEQTEELRGISRIAGIDMFLLIAFNTFLDLFMGCTSGAARAEMNVGEGPRMLHFRTLDWGMDALRKVIVQLNFVRGAAGKVIAQSITYAGFVGVLTGVRKDLSISLNFRPNHDTTGPLANLRYYSHQLLVLLGFRPSISSILRQYLLSSDRSMSHPTLKHESSPANGTALSELAEIEGDLPSKPTSAAYLIVSDGNRTVTMEKDHRTAVVKSSSAFISITNHDLSAKSSSDSGTGTRHTSPTTLRVTGMEELVEESAERNDCVVRMWQRSLQKPRKYGQRPCIRKRDVIMWLNAYPITNEETHFATVMDPKAGIILWLRQYVLPAFESVNNVGSVDHN